MTTENNKKENIVPKSVKERNNLDLLELVCQLHYRALQYQTEDLHNAYVEARTELESRFPATSIEGEIKSKEEYNPIGCEHKKDNGWSSWECLSTSTGSGPDVDFDVNIMVCMKCGEIYL